MSRSKREQNKTGNGKPFFAVLSVEPPHDPNVAPEQYMRNYEPARLKLRENVAHVPRVEDRARRELAGYYAQIENLDWNYGRVIAALQDSGLLWNTHVMFFADHGEMAGSHGMFRKTNPYEEVDQHAHDHLQAGSRSMGNGERDESRCCRTMWTLRLLP